MVSLALISGVIGLGDGIETVRTGGQFGLLVRAFTMKIMPGGVFDVVSADLFAALSTAEAFGMVEFAVDHRSLLGDLFGALGAEVLLLTCGAGSHCCNDNEANQC
jgi:hypothetical protein